MGISNLHDLIGFLLEFKAQSPEADKATIQDAASQKFGLSRKRSVFVGNGFAIRFSQAKGRSFSNVVLSLSALKNYDSQPFVVCIVRPHGLEFLLANTTFLKKISHSSKELREDNIKGSFLGHDIVREHNGIPNSIENIPTLFMEHDKNSWAGNLSRLVDATNAISGIGEKFQPTEAQLRNILAAPELARKIKGSDEYRQLEAEIEADIQEKSSEILNAASSDNVNIRGNTIEQIVTGGTNVHALEDQSHRLADGTRLLIDIKTKVMDLSSNPAGYNVDKMLEALARGKQAIAYLFIVIDRDSGTVHTKLLSIFDSVISRGTRVQHHWAGRNSRGAAQLSCDWDIITNKDYKESIEIDESKEFLGNLIEL